MNTKNKSLFISASVIFLTVAILFFSLNKQNGRNQYEKFLISEISNFQQTNNKFSEKFDKPEQAVFQNFLMTLDPKLGRVPEDRLYKSYLQTKKNAPKTESLVWENIPVMMGGRSRTLMWDPNNAGGNKVWSGSVTGGLWYNNNITDVNSTWQPVNDFWESLSVGTMAYDPNNTQIFYAGTGEPETAVTTYRESSGVGIGIMKSTDGGQTWNLLSSTSDFKYITDIVVRNENGSSVIYAGVVSGVYQGETQQSIPNDGLYRSTDGGTTWTQVLPNIPGEDVPYSPSDIEITADGRIFVGTMPNLNEKGAATILFSDTGLSDSWTIYNNYVSTISAETPYNIPGRVKLAAAPSDANIIYAAIASGSDTETVESFRKWVCNHIIRSDDKGLTWTEKNIPEDGWAYLAWHALVMKVDPNNSDNLYAGGLDLYKSTDGANSWTHITSWYANESDGNYVHADQHKIAYKPGNSDEMIFATDGGVFYTSSGTDSYPVFEQRNNNLNTLQSYSCAINPNEGSTEFLGGLQDNGTVVHLNNQPISVDNMISGGDGAYCFYDDDQPYFSITSVYDNAYYFWSNYNYVNYGGGSSGTFVSPADYDSENNILFCNAVTFTGSYQDKILRISGIPNNISEQFIAVNTGAGVPFSCIRVSPYSPTNGTTIFAGTMSGRIYKIEHADTNPVTTELTTMNFPTAAVSSISFGESENSILITFSNYGVSSVWLTEDGGTTWTEKEGNLPDIPVRWSVIHPDNSKNVMLATELGIWITDDITAENVVWSQAINGMANVRVDMLDMRNNDNTVLAGTHGRGFFTTIYNVEGSSIPEVKQTEISLYPVPANHSLFVKTNERNIKYDIFDISGKHFKSGYLNHSENKIDISDLPSGNYIFITKETSKKFITVK